MSTFIGILLSCSFLFSYTFSLAQSPQLYPYHRFLYSDKDSIEVESLDYLLLTDDSPSRIQFEWSVLTKENKEITLSIDSIVVERDQTVYEIYNKRKIGLDNFRSLGSFDGRFKKTVKYSDKSFSSTQSFYVEVNDNGICILSLVNRTTDSTITKGRYIRNIIDFENDSSCIETFISLNSTYIGDKLFIDVIQEVNNQIDQTKRFSFLYNTENSQFSFALNRLGGEHSNGGRSNIQLSMYTTEKDLLFEFKKIELFVRGAVDQKRIVSTRNDPYNFSTFSTAEIEELFELCAFFENKQEAQIRRAIISHPDKVAFLIRFWTIREQPAESYLPNYSKLVERIRIAQATMSGYFNTPYFQTDRGRVLLIYGVPDEIEKDPFGHNTVSAEVWNYYSIENGVEFIFIDRHRSNDFKLVHSTKVGETYNPDFDKDFQ